MKTIIIDGVIGWDVYARSIRRQLDEANGDQVEIHLASPGGFVYDGLEMHNIIRDYNSNTNKVTIIIKALAASMASYISLAVPKNQRYAEDNAVFMIHNVWGFSVGDYREMNKIGKYFEALTNLLAKGYSKSSGKKLDEIRQLMDDETWYFGDEIYQNGFVSKIIEHEKKEGNNYTRDEYLSLSKSNFDNMISNLQKHKDEAIEDLSRASALMTIKSEIKIPASAGNNNNTEVIMNLEQLKKDHPELYAQVIQIGKDEEFDRVSAHITMGESANSLDIAVKHIKAKTGFNQAVSAEYMSAGMKNQSLQNRKSDDVTTGGQADTNDDEADTQALTQNLLKKRGVKNGK